jgi:hypothetical protein
LITTTSPALLTSTGSSSDRPSSSQFCLESTIWPRWPSLLMDR